MTLLLSAAVWGVCVLCAALCAASAVRGLDQWFLCALSRDMARGYLMLLPRAVRFLRLHTLAVGGYFERLRNLFLWTYWTALIGPPVALAALIAGNERMAVAFCVGYLISGALPFLLHRLLMRARGTDGRRYEPFDRFAPLSAPLKKNIQREKANATCTRFYGAFLRMDYVTDEKELTDAPKRQTEKKAQQTTARKP